MNITLNIWLIGILACLILGVLVLILRLESKEDKHGFIIALLVVEGILLAIVFILSMIEINDTTLACFVNTNPWTIITAIGSAPVLIMLWYWRETHKRSDQALERHRIVADKLELAFEKLANQDLLIKLSGINAFRTIICGFRPDNEYAYFEIMNSLILWIRNRFPNNDKELDLENKSIVQAIIEMIGQRHAKWIEIESDQDWNLDFSSTNLAGIKFSKIYYRGIFKNAIFSGANLKGCDFRLADLTGATFHKTTEEKNTNLEKVKFGNAILVNTNISGQNLKDVDFFNATLNDTNITGSNLEGAFFVNSKISNVVFYNNSMDTKIDFTGAKFENVSFIGNDLSNISFQQAKFKGKMEFKDVVFNGANFNMATICSLNLLGSSNLKGVKYSKKTTKFLHDPCFNPELEGMIPIEE